MAKAIMEKGKSIKVAVLGCTGLVGQQFVRMLNNHPFFELSALTASSRSAGKLYGEALSWSVSGEMPENAKRMVIGETSAAAIHESGIKIVFSALPSSLAETIELELRRRGIFVFSNAGARRMDDDVPILIPEINAGHLEMVQPQVARYGGFIITNSNCSTSGFTMALKPLLPFGLRAVTVTTFQSISGAGRRGLPAMDIAANLIPFICNEEEKIEQESKKILGTFSGQAIVPPELEINASCCRVPVREGHLLSLAMNFENPVDPETAAKAMTAFRGLPQTLKLPTAPEQPIIVRSEEDRPQPVLDVYAGTPDRAKGMAVTVGRIRGKNGSLNLFLLVHNTVRGAAGTCILSAELAVQKGLIA